MGRPAANSSMSLVQLENLLSGRRKDLVRLNKLRSKLLKKLAGVESKIYGISGGAPMGGTGSGPRRGPGSRVKNTTSLKDLLVAILTKAGGPLGVGEITDKALASGYKTNSENFRGIVNQTLIKENKRFVSPQRSLYKLK